jgi:malonyl-CoA O-methyltransferase
VSGPEDFDVDKRGMRSSFERAAADYDRVAVLQREVGDRLLERLGVIKLDPKTVLDLGAGTGYITRALMKRYRSARVVALDIASPMLVQARKQSGWWRRPGFVCGDIERLPFADRSVDLVMSNLALQWCNGLDAAFAEFKRVLKPGGALLFTSFGPDTLRELRTSWAAVDGYNHVNSFLDMHDVGDALLRAGLAEPVMDVEKLTLTYTEVNGLVQDLKTLGAHNVTAGRPRGLMGRGRWQRMCAAYEQYRQQDLLPASYEVIYGHAWSAESSAKATDGVVNVPLSVLKRRPGSD